MNKWLLAALLLGALLAAPNAQAIAQAGFAFSLLMMFLLSTPLVLFLPFLFAGLFGTAVVFAAFYINYSFQKKLIESVGAKPDDDGSDREAGE
jgi:membrane protein implicated in regulation of membrane protease activity